MLPLAAASASQLPLAMLLLAVHSRGMAVAAPRSTLPPTPLLGCRCYSHDVFQFSLFCLLPHCLTSPLLFSEASPAGLGLPHSQTHRNQEGTEVHLFQRNETLGIFFFCRKHSIHEKPATLQVPGRYCWHHAPGQYYMWKPSLDVSRKWSSAQFPSRIRLHTPLVGCVT